MVIFDNLRCAICAGLVGVCCHTAHLPLVPPYKREEHTPESAPVRGTDMGVQIVYSAVTSGSTAQTWG
jgi:hypothetical protein